MTRVRVWVALLVATALWLAAFLYPVYRYLSPRHVRGPLAGIGAAAATSPDGNEGTEPSTCGL